MCNKTELFGVRYAAVSMPYKRLVHYWAKSGLFAHPLAKFILTSSGVIPVDRKNKDNQVLFKATFEAFAQNEVVGIFPEGTRCVFNLLCR